MPDPHFTALDAQLADAHEEARRLALEVERLQTGLAKANANHEEFERRWYLATDEVEALRKALGEACDYIESGSAYCSDCDKGGVGHGWRALLGPSCPTCSAKVTSFRAGCAGGDASSVQGRASVGYRMSMFGAVEIEYLPDPKLEAMIDEATAWLTLLRVKQDGLLARDAQHNARNRRWREPCEVTSWRREAIGMGRMIDGLTEHLSRMLASRIIVRAVIREWPATVDESAPPDDRVLALAHALGLVDLPAGTPRGPT